MLVYRLNFFLADHTFLFQGAGEAAIGIAELIVMAMKKKEGIPREEALKKIWMKDSRGLKVGFLNIKRLLLIHMHL